MSIVHDVDHSFEIEPDADEVRTPNKTGTGSRELARSLQTNDRQGCMSCFC